MSSLISNEALLPSLMLPGPQVYGMTLEEQALLNNTLAAVAQVGEVSFRAAESSHAEEKLLVCFLKSHNHV